MAARVTAIIGATVIDGTGAPARPDATVIIRGKRIDRIGSRQAIKVPSGATVIDGRGLFMLPGFVDANVHVALNSLFDPQKEAINRLRDALRHGVTTIRDSYGHLGVLRTVRDSIRSGQLVGARLLIAGNIVGWTDTRDSSWTQGVGEELVAMDAESVRVRINKYLDKGVDFIKYGTTAHFGLPRILFSDRAQRVIVEETHKRGLIAEAHTTSPEAVRMAVHAGVDLIQHPEITFGENDSVSPVLSDDLVQLIVRRRVICSINVDWAVTGYLKSAMSSRTNAEKLIRAGCIVALATDASSPFEGGEQALRSVQALVTLGMTPMGALVAATRNGASAAGMLGQFGTIEAGKFADLVLWRADPLQDIRNINAQQIVMVFKEGALAVTVPPFVGTGVKS